MAPLLLEAIPQRKTGSWNLDETVEEDATFTSTKLLTREEVLAEAGWADERLRFPTGDFDTAYDIARTRHQITGAKDSEEAESVAVDANVMSRGEPEPTLPEAAISLRATEKAWIESHIKELSSFAGEWLVVEGEQLIAHNVDLVEAVKEARSHGVQVPYLTKLSAEKEKPFIG